jgi:diguanylate cyclase (GGDEF)-like protein
MLTSAGHTTITLDIGTLSVVATCVTMLLGLLLLFVWSQDRVRALAWWGTAYLAGGLSVVVWGIEDAITPPLPKGIAIALLLFACGMTWSAARLMHGRPVLWGGMTAGAAIWLLACLMPGFVQWGAGRIVLGCLTVSIYAFLTAAELRRERRRAPFGLLRRWPAFFAPALHGAVFLLPLPLALLVPADRGVVSLASGWIAVLLVEAMLYVVGTAFVVLVLAKEQTARTHKTAASTDELTGLLNRRGVLASAQQLIDRAARRQEPMSVLMFDLDHFKSINDRFGHRVGDETLCLFAAVATAQLRASDLIGRFGGEEFLAVLPGTLEDAAVAAERLRLAFQAAAANVAGCDVGATVSIGAASGLPNTDMASLLIRSDAALYRAKAAGRNRLEIARDEIPTIFTTAPSTGRSDRVEGHGQGLGHKHRYAGEAVMAA